MKAVPDTVQQQYSSGLKNHQSPLAHPAGLYPPDLQLSASSCNLRFSLFLSEQSPREMCAKEKQLKIYLPARGGSVNVRTKRREKRTKLLLSAFGNIYPPFIVTPLFRNVKKYTEVLHRRRPLLIYNVTRFTQCIVPIFIHSKRTLTKKNNVYEA